ncbi:MAG: thioester domain-containing protein [Propionibacteriaceae bacterium]|nr:thioester domain-containing protein [Propionibacteriaceae bacterium]
MRTPNRAVPRYVLAAMMAAAMLFSAFVSPQARAEEYADGYPKLGTSQELFYGHYVERDGKPMSTQLLAVHSKPGADPFYAYCIELDVHALWGTDLEQVGWDQFPGENRFKTDATVRAKVGWIVQRSYPQTPLAEVAKAAGVEGLTEKEAVAATQSAIWHLTNGFEWNGVLWDHYGQAVDTDAARTQRVKKLYDHLLGPANTGMQESAGPALSIKAPEQAGEAGTKVGPIRIESTAATVALAGDLPYPLVTAEGKAVDMAAAPTGQDLFLDVPADAPTGEAMVSSSLFGQANAGQLLVGKGKRTQTIILVSSTPKKVDANAKLMWTAKPAPAPTPSPSTPAPSTPAPTPSPSTPAPSTPAPSMPTPNVPKPTPMKPGLPKTGF